MTDQQYFAAKDAEDLISHIQGKFVNIAATGDGASQALGVYSAYWRNLAAYYSPLLNPDSFTTSLNYVGEQGELVKMVNPLARTFVKQFVSLITRQRLSFECTTDVTDADPEQSAKLGKAICNSLVDSQRLDEKQETLAERVAVLGHAFVSCRWKTDAGYIFAVEQAEDGTEIPRYSGDVEISLHDYMDGIFDWTIEDWNKLNWFVLKVPMNRWDLVAQNPELKEQILALPSMRQNRNLYPNYSFISTYDNSDMVYVYEFYHKPTPAMPRGRMTVYGSSDCVLFDSPDFNPYGKIPVNIVKYETIAGTGLGYPYLSSLLPCQEMVDMGLSAQATNIQAFGVQNVLVPRGSGLSPISADGMNWLEYTPAGAEGGGKPEALQLTATPPELPNFVNMMNEFMRTNAMIPSTLSGTPPANVTSGAMAATLSTNALEFLSSGTKAITIAFENIMNMAIEWYKKFGTVERIVEIVGDSQSTYVKKFTADTLKSIKRIRVRTQSPLLSTVAGRVQLGEALLNIPNAVKDPSKYVQLLEGSPASVTYEDSYDEQIAVKQEVDALLEGRNVIPHWLENHPLYIKGYKKIVANPAFRLNAKVSADLSEIMDWRANEMQAIMADPIRSQLWTMINDQPLPGAQPPQASQGPGGPPPGAAMAQMADQSASPADPAQAQA